jgi:hypothetical protein
MRDVDKYMIIGAKEVLTYVGSASKAEKIARDHSKTNLRATVYEREYPGAEYMRYSSFQNGRKN